MGKANSAFRIGPDMPDVPAVNSRDIPTTPETEVGVNPAAASVDTGVVRTQDAFGNIVETITAVQAPKTETVVQLEAREKERYVDGQGNTVVTY